MSNTENTVGTSLSLETDYLHLEATPVIICPVYSFTVMENRDNATNLVACQQNSVQQTFFRERIPPQELLRFAKEYSVREIMGLGLVIINLWNHFQARGENCCQSLGLSSRKMFVDSQIRKCEHPKSNQI